MMRLAMTMALIVVFLATSHGSLKVEGVEVSGTIYLRADGSIDPPSAPIQRNEDLYTLTDNIIVGHIVIERDKITLDGQGYAVHGTEVSGEIGIYVSGRSNVTIKNAKVDDFHTGILLDSSSNSSVTRNEITAFGGAGIVLSNGCQYNRIVENNITAKGGEGIFLLRSSNYQRIAGNNITESNYGLSLYYSSNNAICENRISNSNCGIHLHRSSNDSIYHNSLINNTVQVYTVESTNNWDAGYPSGGNYWSNYTGQDTKTGVGQNLTGSDGIGDAPLTIDTSNIDHYPLVDAYVIPESPSFLLLPIATATALLVVRICRREYDTHK